MNKQKQQGLTLISWTFVMIIAGVLLMIILKVGPMYMDYYKVVQIVKSTAVDIKDSKITEREVRSSLNKRFNVDYLSFIKKDNIKIYRTSGGKYVDKIDIDYQVKKIFFDQIYFVGDFHTSTEKKIRKLGGK